jgi:hypothetical protein
MWYFSNVIRYLLLLPCFIIPMVSVVVPYVFSVFSIWLEYPELPLLFLMACICSLYLVLNVLPV